MRGTQVGMFVPIHLAVLLKTPPTPRTEGIPVIRLRKDTEDALAPALGPGLFSDPWQGVSSQRRKPAPLVNMASAAPWERSIAA